MSIRLHVEVCKKEGTANYGSIGATCGLEVEIDLATLADPSAAVARIRGFYSLCELAMNEELARLKDPAAAAAATPTNPPPAKRPADRTPPSRRRSSPPPSSTTRSMTCPRMTTRQRTDDACWDGHAANPRTPRTGWSDWGSGYDIPTGSSTGRQSKSRRPTRATGKPTGGRAVTRERGPRGEPPRGPGTFRRGLRRLAGPGLRTLATPGWADADRDSEPHPPFPPLGDGRGESPAGGLGGTTHVSGAERPTACLPRRLVEPPQGILGAQTSRGGAGCPDQPGHDAQAERSDPAAGMTGTPGGTAAGAGPRRGH